MLFIILLILKIIGITLLVILGLLLFLILTVLLVPIRYRVAVEHGDELFRLRGRVHWLLHILHASITHLEGVLHIRVRVFGYVIFDNLNPRKPKIKKDRLSAGKQEKAARKARFRAAKGKKEAVEPKPVALGGRKEATSQEITGVSNEATKQADENTGKEGIVKEQPKRYSTEDEHKDTIRIVPTHDSLDNKPDELPEGLRKYAIYEAPDEDEGANNISTENASKDTANEEDVIEEKVSFYQKVLNKLKLIKEKVVSFFNGLKSKLIKLIENVTNIKHKIGLISDFIKDEINREGFSITYSSLKRLLKHIKPRKLKSKLVFGTGDPCSTGQVLGVLGVLYGFYGDKVQIIPDFENNRFEGTHYARGRIRLITILIIVIKLILDKRFKQLKSNFQILKEAL